MELHAVVVPFPAQGHINPMFQLALKLLLPADHGCFTRITFINTRYNHDRILANGQCRDLLHLPGLKLLCIDDGLPPDHGRLNDPRIQQFADAVDALFEPLQELISDIALEASRSPSEPPVTCIISDAYIYWMPDIADGLRLPWVPFWTIPAHGCLAYCSITPLLNKGILPVVGKRRESTQRMVDCIPGLHPLKACELPSFLQSPDGLRSDFFFQWCVRRFDERVLRRARCHIGHTTYELDKAAADAFQEHLGVEFLPVGPLLPPAFFSGQMDRAPAMATGIWAEAEGCKEWLDKQENRSVLYISFGSIVHMGTQQVQELAAGIEASRHPFLWVLRLDVDAETLEKLEGFKERTRHCGFIVSWAPQLLVLSHRSVGAFLTHCGWNSILESIAGGIPMLAWPGGFSEQKLNARYIMDVWQIALGFIEELTEEGLMIVKKEEVVRVISIVLSACSKQSKTLMERVLELQKIVRDATLSPYGSSQANLFHFVNMFTRPPLTMQAS